MILIIDNYDSFTYNLYQYLEELGAHCKVLRNDALSLDQIQALKPKKIVISPGPGSPEESGISLEIIEKLGPSIPILGVCLGHQAIGHVFGARVLRAPKPMHGKISKISHQGKGIFKGLPPTLYVARYHSLMIEAQSLPSCLEVTALTLEGPDAGTIMGLRHKKYPIEGLQFHPESFATPHGKDLVRNFLRKQK